MTEPADESGGPDPATDKALDLIAKALRGLRFGQLTIVVQDGVVIQLERTERLRVGRGRRA
jgi:hypothetical protein